MTTALLLAASVVAGIAPSQASSASSAPVVNAAWAATGRMSGQRATGATATTLKDGRVLVAGGRTAIAAEDQARSLASVEIYDPTSGTWSTAPDMQVSRAGQAAALLPSGKVLVAGGITQDCYNCPFRSQSSAEIYDPVANIWTWAPDMGTIRVGTTASPLKDGRILVLGGYGGDSDPNSENTAEIFDESTNSWSQAGDTLPHLYPGPALTLMNDGRVFALGGTYSGSDGTGTSDIYDPVANTWTSGPPPLNIRPNPVGGYSLPATSTLLADGRLLIVGYDAVAGTALTQFYDPQSNQYAPAPTTLAVHEGQTATALPDGRALVVGGYENATSEIFDPGSNTWTLAGNMLGTRGGHIAALLPDNSVLVATGEGRDDDQGGASLGFLLTTERSAPLAPTTIQSAALDTSRSASGQFVGLKVLTASDVDNVQFRLKDPFLGDIGGVQASNLLKLIGTVSPSSLLWLGDVPVIQAGFHAVTISTHSLIGGWTDWSPTTPSVFATLMGPPTPRVTVSGQSIRNGSVVTIKNPIHLSAAQSTDGLGNKQGLAFKWSSATGLTHTGPTWATNNFPKNTTQRITLTVTDSAQTKSTLGFDVCVACTASQFSWDLVPDPTGPIGFGQPASLTSDTQGGFQGTITVHNNRDHAWVGVKPSSIIAPSPSTAAGPLNGLWAKIGVLPPGDDATYYVQLPSVFGDASFIANEGSSASLAFFLAKAVDLAIGASSDVQLTKTPQVVQGLVDVMNEIQNVSTFRHFVSDLRAGKVVEVASDLISLASTFKTVLYQKVAQPLAVTLGTTITQDAFNATILRPIALAPLAYDVLAADYEVISDLYGGGSTASNVIFADVHIDG